MSLPRIQSDWDLLEEFNFAPLSVSETEIINFIRRTHNLDGLIDYFKEINRPLSKVTLLTMTLHHGVFFHYACSNRNLLWCLINHTLPEALDAVMLETNHAGQMAIFQIISQSTPELKNDEMLIHLLIEKLSPASLNIALSKPFLHKSLLSITLEASNSAFEKLLKKYTPHDIRNSPNLQHLLEIAIMKNIPYSLFAKLMGILKKDKKQLAELLNRRMPHGSMKLIEFSAFPTNLSHLLYGFGDSLGGLLKTFYDLIPPLDTQYIANEGGLNFLRLIPKKLLIKPVQALLKNHRHNYFRSLSYLNPGYFNNLIRKMRSVDKELAEQLRHFVARLDYSNYRSELIEDQSYNGTIKASSKRSFLYRLVPQIKYIADKKHRVQEDICAERIIFTQTRAYFDNFNYPPALVLIILNYVCSEDLFKKLQMQEIFHLQINDEPMQIRLEIYCSLFSMFIHKVEADCDRIKLSHAVLQPIMDYLYLKPVPLLPEKMTFFTHYFKEDNVMSNKERHIPRVNHIRD